MLKRRHTLGLVGLAMTIAMLVAVMGASAAFGASEFQTNEGALAGTTITGTGGAATFETEKGATVTCEHSSSTGKINSALEAEVQVTYSGKCELKGASAGNGACTNPITTKELLVQPGIIAGGTERGLDFTASTLAEFECGSFIKAKIKVTGSAICESRGSNVGPSSVYLKTGEVVCAKGTKAGEQLYTSINIAGTADEGDFLTAEGESFGIKTTEKDSQTTTESLTYGKSMRQT